MHSKKITVRFASAVSAAVIGFTSTAISFFDCPVYAAYGGAAWGEFFGFYSLLEGFGFGQDNTDFINSVDNWIDSLQPEEKPREDYDGEWMTDAQYWQQCQYDKFTGWLDNLVGSWSESYDAVGDVGSGGASSIPFTGNFYTAEGFASIGDDFTYDFGHDYVWRSSSVDLDHPLVLALVNDDLYLFGYYSDMKYINLSFSTNIRYRQKSSLGFCYIDISGKYTHTPLFFASSNFPLLSGFDGYYHLSWDEFSLIIDFFSLESNFKSVDEVCNFLNANEIDWQPGKTGSDSFIGPVYTYPAAQELARQNKTSTGIRLDVKTADGVPDVKAALDGAGVSTVDELVASVAAGDVAMQDVFADAKVTPYVVADTTSGVVVTDLGVAADAAGVKPVALTKELTVPADLTAAATYAIQGKTWDPDMAKYRLPLFQYFPFCLPWDIYQVLTSFAADPVAPQIEIPIGKFFANKKSFDGSAVANYTETLDLGDEKFSKWFSALRLLESAGIIIGLVLISVHLIHGGR